MRSRELVLIGAVMAAAALLGPARGQTAKNAPVRHGYDFTRPEPDEILPNPAEGVGSPPQLRAYTDAKDMTTNAASGTSAKSASATGNTPNQATNTPEPPVTRLPSKDRVAPPQRGTAEQASSQTIRIARHIQATLSQEVVTLGIAGPFEYHPSAAARSDPELKASEKRAWDGVVDSLALSWRDWQAGHSSGDARRSAAPSPGSASPAATLDPTLSSAVVQSAEGRIVLTGAPPSVTGDLPDGPR